jgi:hypothetical protein
MKLISQLITIALLFLYINAPAQNSCEFDSLKVYYLKFQSTQIIQIDETYLPYIGDSVKIIDALKIDSVFNDLIIIGKEARLNAKKVNKNYTRYSIDLRVLFKFYKNGVITSIGFSPTSLMIIENEVLYYKMEDLINIKKKYDNLTLPLAGVY